ncbi:hypothetical protein V8C86DRAFT_2766923 [Haematococcus lacustris]
MGEGCGRQSRQGLLSPVAHMRRLQRCQQALHPRPQVLVALQGGPQGALGQQHAGQGRTAAQQVLEQSLQALLLAGQLQHLWGQSCPAGLRQPRKEQGGGLAAAEHQAGGEAAVVQQQCAQQVLQGGAAHLLCALHYEHQGARPVGRLLRRHMAEQPLLARQRLYRLACAQDPARSAGGLAARRPAARGLAARGLAARGLAPAAPALANC